MVFAEQKLTELEIDDLAKGAQPQPFDFGQAGQQAVRWYPFEHSRPTMKRRSSLQQKSLRAVKFQKRERWWNNCQRRDSGHDLGVPWWPSGYRRASWPLEGVQPSRLDGRRQTITAGSSDRRSSEVCGLVSTWPRALAHFRFRVRKSPGVWPRRAIGIE